jgi:transcriptional regulator with XRE-family HTH domain
MKQIRDKQLLQKISIVIKQLREDSDVSQEEVYNETNIHVGRIETANANPTVSTLSALCKYFKIKLSDFYKKVEQIK